MHCADQGLLVEMLSYPPGVVFFRLYSVSDFKRNMTKILIAFFIIATAVVWISIGLFLSTVEGELSKFSGFVPVSFAIYVSGAIAIVRFGTINTCAIFATSQIGIGVYAPAVCILLYREFEQGHSLSYLSDLVCMRCIHSSALGLERTGSTSLAE